MSAAESGRASFTTGSGLEPPETLMTDDFQWLEGAYDIEDFLRVYDLPQIVKVDSGDYGNFGTGTHVDVGRPFLLTARRSCSKVLAASVYWDDSRQEFVEVGPRVVIPVTYKGWFWYLQDFARVGNVWNTVEQVATSRPRPRALLIREPVPCYRTQGVLRPGVQRLYRQEQLAPGEVLATGDIYSESQPLPKSTCCMGCLPGFQNRKRASIEIKYLQCRDPDGHDVLLEFNQAGQFMGVGEAGTMLEGAVYRLPDVLASSTLPTYVKLAQGQPPASPCSFTGLLRLEEIYMEETVIACCLGRSVPTMVEFPTDSDIQFISCTSGPEIFQHDLVSKAMDYCKANIEHYVTTIKVVQNFYPDHIIKSEMGGGLRGRALPELPVMSADQASEIADSIDTMTTEDFSHDSETDDSESNSNMALNKSLDEESNYEVIPGDVRRRTSNNDSSPQLLVDEDGYLEPLKVNNKNSAKRTPNTSSRMPHGHQPVSQVNPDTEKPIHTIFMDRRNKLVLQIENTVTESSDDIPFVPDKHTPSTVPIVHNHLEHIKTKTLSLDRETSAPSPLNQMRLKFPSLHTIPIDEYDTGFDAYDEFYNMKMVKESHTSLQTNPDNRMFHTPQFPAQVTQNPDLETNEGVTAFLEDIFDYDNMDIEKQALNLPPKRGSHDSPLDSVPPIVHRRVYRRPSDASATMSENSLVNSAFSNPDPVRGEHNLSSLRLMVPRRESCEVYQGSVVGESDERPELETSFMPIPEPPRFDLSPAEARMYAEYDNGAPSTPSSEADVGERRTNRSDSGIYLSRWSDVRPECESPYLSPSEDSWTPPEDISQLSVLDVARCLRYIGIKQALAVRFVEEQVDGKQLQELSDELLREGMPELNAFERKKIIDFTQGWRPKKL